MVGGALEDAAHGAAVPAEGCGGAGAVDVAVAVVVLLLWAGGAAALGSASHENREPNGKCCTTGNLDRTSALYILIMPLLILPHPSRIPEMSNSMGLCSQNGPVLMSLMNPMAEKYMLVCR